MKELEEKMRDYGFFRCGKGFLVNMKKVDTVKNNDCEINGVKIPISRIKRKEFMELLIQYVNEV